MRVTFHNFCSYESSKVRKVMRCSQPPRVIFSQFKSWPYMRLVLIKLAYSVLSSPEADMELLLSPKVLSQEWSICFRIISSSRIPRSCCMRLSLLLQYLSFLFSFSVIVSSLHRAHSGLSSVMTSSASFCPLFSLREKLSVSGSLQLPLHNKVMHYL